MSYGGGYKRPRHDGYGHQPGYAEPLGYGAPVPDYGPPMGPGPGQMGPGAGPLAGPVLDGAPMGPAGPLGGPLGAGLGSDAEGNLPLVKLRGLPFNCDERDVRAFLEVDTVDILFVRRGGRLSGEAFVLLPGAFQADYALGKHKAYMGKRYVEVQKAYREDYYRAVVQHVADVDSGAAPPFVRGHPSHSDRPPAAYGGPPMGANGAGMPMGMRGPPGGMGGPPMGAPHMGGPPLGGQGGGGWGGGGNMGGGHAGHSRGPPPPLQPPRLALAPGCGLLKLRGLPFSATAAEVAAWFNDAGVLAAPLSPDHVQLVVAHDGRPSGTAFVEFASQAEASAAMVRDKAMMGSRYVELFQSSRDEYGQATGTAY